MKAWTWVISGGVVALLLSVGAMIYQVRQHETEIQTINTSGSNMLREHMKEGAVLQLAVRTDLEMVRNDVENLKLMRADLVEIKTMLKMHMEDRRVASVPSSIP